MGIWKRLKKYDKKLEEEKKFRMAQPADPGVSKKDWKSGKWQKQQQKRPQSRQKDDQAQEHARIGEVGE